MKAWIHICSLLLGEIQMQLEIFVIYLGEKKRGDGKLKKPTYMSYIPNLILLLRRVCVRNLSSEVHKMQLHILWLLK